MSQRIHSDDIDLFQTELGKALRGLRKEKQETLVDVAAAVDRHRSFISELESGKHNPSIDTLRLLCAHYGVDTSQLILTVEEQVASYQVNRKPASRFNPDRD